MNRITSRDNQKLKLARKVRDGKDKNLLFLEGLRLAEEAVRSGIDISECFVSETFGNGDRGRELLEQLSCMGAITSEVPNALFDSIADTDATQGIILLGRRPETGIGKIRESLISNPLKLIVYLHEVNNPSNLGALLRTAEAAGAAGVIASKNSADPFSPKALRSAMGASLRVPLWERADIDEVLELASAEGLRAIAADIKATRPYTEVDWKKPALVVFGSEAHGLSSKILERMDLLTYIPMENSVESLNLAVSSGILLFEARRQNSR